MTREDVVIVGAGLAGLVAAADLADAGRRVVLLDGQAKRGGQAIWSLGGVFLVGTPEQRRLGVRDTAEVALADWLASAEFDDGPHDAWARRWANAYVGWAATESHRVSRRLLTLTGWSHDTTTTSR